jgi:hypothetical protein
MATSTLLAQLDDEHLLDILLIERPFSFFCFGFWE